MHEYVKSLAIKSAENAVSKELLELRDDYRSKGIATILTESLNSLILTAKLVKPTKILEFGTSVGCSGIALLNACPEAVLYTVERYRPAEDEAMKNFKKFGLDKRVFAFFGEATEVVDEVGEGFDFVFLDCNKSKYKDLLPKIKAKMKSGGVLFADNVLFRGYITGEVKTPHRHNTIRNNMRGFLETISSDEDFITAVSDTGDGISVSYKK
mgnify:CR=1 FL=1